MGTLGDRRLRGCFIHKVGYRGLEETARAATFPFGHGLGYTTFGKPAKLSP